MKLLLTSAGLTNQSIARALEELLRATAKDRLVAFIPTAANVEPGEKDWLVEDMVNCMRVGFHVDIVDISSLSKSQWLPRFQAADVLLLGGGNTFHLMRWVQESRLQSELPTLLQSKVYVGISAGSCIVGPTIYNAVQRLFGEKYELQIEQGLGLVDFHFIPHLNSPFFEKITKPNIVEAASKIMEPVYALDDDSAIKMDGSMIEIVSEGAYLACNIPS